MRSFLRPAALVLPAVLLALAPRAVAAQRKAPPVLDNQWYIGPQGGILIFETDRQTRGAIPAAGGHVFINLNQVGILLQVLEGIGSNEAGNFWHETDFISPPSVRQVSFNDIRIFNAMVVLSPVRSIVQPYFGFGAAFVQVVNPQTNFVSVDPSARQKVTNWAERVGNYGAGSFMAGLQFKVDRFCLFGQAQVYSAAPTKKIGDFFGDTLVSVAGGHVLTGPMYTLTAGLRLGLGSARSEESIKE